MKQKKIYRVDIDLSAWRVDQDTELNKRVHVFGEKTIIILNIDRVYKKKHCNVVLRRGLKRSFIAGHPPNFV